MEIHRQIPVYKSLSAVVARFAPKRATRFSGYKLLSVKAPFMSDERNFDS